MHPNRAFRGRSLEDNIHFIHERSFGALCINSDNGPLISHIPVQLSQDGKHLEGHLVRSNPILSHLESPVPAVVSINGADGYISPDWYGFDDQVPTWNYVAVHIRGKLERLPIEELDGILERLSAAMEKRLLPKNTLAHRKNEP